MKTIHNEKLKEHYLQRSQIQQFLPRDLHSQLKLVRYKKGEFICHEGSKINGLFIQVQGKSKVTRSMNNGKEMLTCFNSGLTMLGHLELFTSRLAFNNVEVIEDTFCFVLSLNEYNKKILMQDVLFLQYMATDLANMLIKENNNSAINLVYPVKQRVASYILCTHQDGLFKENYTHLSEYLGCSHRQLLRVLKEFVQENILEIQKKGYFIKNKERLELIAAELYSK